MTGKQNNVNSSNKKASSYPFPVTPLFSRDNLC